ncbi:hypothetical protein GW17_00002038 [Ensete ventricosum]|nr:hypothetical protein GW17_00002038 [Ensete ventricosum]
MDTNDSLRLASLWHSMHAISQQLSPTTGCAGIELLQAHTFDLHCFQSLTGTNPNRICRFAFEILMYYPGTLHMEALLKVIYELYTDYVLKNPFYEMEMPIRLASRSKFGGGCWSKTALGQAEAEKSPGPVETAVVNDRSAHGLEGIGRKRLGREFKAASLQGRLGEGLEKLGVGRVAELVGVVVLVAAEDNGVGGGLSSVMRVIAKRTRVMEYALLENSFEANVRDYTKLIDLYAKRNLLENAENSFQAMQKRGFPCDQVTLTVLINMYSKAGHLDRAKEAFEEIKLLSLPVDKRAYGSMLMAYIRAEMLEHAEILMKEMEEQECYTGKEVYKALLRAYSTNGNADGAQRVFNSIQFAGIVPDSRLCALLINAYYLAGQSSKARSVFENMRIAGLEPSDRCIALMLGAYERENKLDAALSFLIELEHDGVLIAEEASQVLVGWFRRLGVVGEVQQVLREFAVKGAGSFTPYNACKTK